MENRKIQALKERARRMKVDSIQLKDIELPQELASFFNFSFVNQNKVVPVNLEGDTLSVAMENPTDLYLVEQMELKTRKKIIPLLADTEDIMTCIHLLYTQVTEKDIKIPRLENEDFLRLIKMIDPDTLDWFHRVLAKSINRQASDLHIETYENNVKVRIRIDGVIADTVTLPRTMEPQIYTLVKSLADLKLEKRHVPQEGSFTVKVWEREMSIRVGCLPTFHGERLVLKFLDERQLIKPIAELGITEKDLGKIEETLKHRSGLFVVSGPSGNGLTATLYSLINYKSRPEINVITLEDPVEASLDSINQIQVNPQFNMDFPEAINIAMKHVPDVMMISRIDNPDTARNSINSALRGNLVLAGIYARNAVDVIFRLRDLNIESSYLALSVIGVISQRLIRKICPNCRETVETSQDLLDEFDKYQIDGPYDCVVGKGCSNCLQTGYRGRIGIYEFLPVDESFKAHISKNIKRADLEIEAKRSGMNSLYHNGLIKVARGFTTLTELKRILID
ncbi:MAG: GspE/PulE family protein [Vulcanimicrobiota bacterium]